VTDIVVREERALTPAQQRTEGIRNALNARLPDILPEGMTPERFAAIAVQAVAKSPDLMECEPQSIIMACLEAAQVGLEPTGAVGGAHLVAFTGKDKVKRAQLIFDYRGLQHLIREGGGGDVKAVAVYEGDSFHVYEGTSPRIEHEPSYETSDPAEMRFVYAWPLDHPEKFEVMTRSQIDAIRARSRAGNFGPWVSDYVQMARKTCIRRLSNYLPLKPSARAAIERDVEREFNRDDAPVVESRTATVKASIAARLAPHSEALGAAEAPEVVPEPAPAESASQQPPDDATADAREICGAGSDPDLGDVEFCISEPGHKGAHTSDAGSKWPNR
jgi:recombination protein RecT